MGKKSNPNAGAQIGMVSGSESTDEKSERWGQPAQDELDIMAATMLKQVSWLVVFSDEFHHDKAIH